MSIPDYRVRLFLTVDLVGSTAYKASFLNSHGQGKDPLPEWVTRFRHFYQRFPEALAAAYQKTDSGSEIDDTQRDPPPKVWKTIGDEIIFCCRVHSVQHLACCVTAFLRALEAYGQSLDTDGVPLDVKGAGWLAAFPAENISIEVFNGNVAATKKNQEYLTEDFELEADSEPHKFDFLGTGIDAGFRVAKTASADRFTASVGLSYLLASAAQNNMFMAQFSYHGRQSFKGVNKDHPYPVVSIEAERNPDKRRLRARERLLLNENFVAPVALFDYLDEYMKHEGIDFPVLPALSSDAPPSNPRTYVAFQATWQTNVKEADGRDKAIDEAEMPANQGGNEISSEVIEFAEANAPRDATGRLAPRARERPRRRPRRKPETSSE
ncbi:hypothetical protein [Rhizobium leguminosarum]|uniref:hypothetical protein n=1 Tax=Rhizobium leguminosarum TaxID=384 RepID=UPI0024B35A45|nr:hypothetical protein [Rhizobium leguminosarum]WHO77455.1 hypothetical protein QMO81_000083 [Rhizobium leguminosarum]